MASDKTDKNLVDCKTDGTDKTEEDPSSSSSTLESPPKRLKTTDDHENRKEAIPTTSDKTNDATTASGTSESRNTSVESTNETKTQNSGKSTTQVPVEIQIHEYAHLYFDESGNQLHQYSSSELEERFVDANGQTVADFDPSKLDQHGLVRREFFHVRHLQVPNAFLKHHLSREDLVRNSIDVYKNTVERVHHPGRPMYGVGGYHPGYAVPQAYPPTDYAPSYMYPPGDTSSQGFYYHNSSSPQRHYPSPQSGYMPQGTPFHRGHVMTQEEKVNDKVSQSNVTSDETSTKKDGERSGADKDKEKASSPSDEAKSHPKDQNHTPLMQGPLHGYPPYIQSNDNRFMYDQGAMYRPGIQPMNPYGYPTQMPYMDSSAGRDSYQPYFEQYPPSYSQHVIRTPPEQHRNPMNGTAQSASKFAAPPSYGAPIYEINEHDVLCGRGGTSNQHIGNRKFRILVKRHQESYLKCKKKDKPAISARIVQLIREMNPPGRFLKQERNNGAWFDVGDARATEKVSQALREGAPAIRKALEGAEEDSKSADGTNDDDMAESNEGNKIKRPTMKV